MIPIELWIVVLLLAIGCTLYLLFVRDRNNYSEAIAGLLGIVFYILTGLFLFIGIVAQNGTVEYQSTSVGWLFIATGVIEGLLTFVRILDIMTERKKETHVNMGPIRL